MILVRGNYKESTASCVRSAQLVFSFLFFRSVYFPGDISDFSFLCYPFERIKIIQRRVIIPQGQHRVSSAQQSLALFKPWFGYGVSNEKNDDYYLTGNHSTTRTAPGLVRSTKFSPVQRGSCLDGLPNTNTLCSNKLFFSFVFFSSLSKAISVTAELPVLCYFFFSIYQLFFQIISPCPY